MSEFLTLHQRLRDKTKKKKLLATSKAGKVR